MKTVGDKVVYLSLDDFFFENNRLITLIENLYEDDYRYFFLDEVHRYAHWSSDLKTLYDNLQDAHFIVTGSSILQLDQGQSDLSRRAVLYRLPGLSFREFLNLEIGEDLAALDLAELIENHEQLSLDIADRMDVLLHFSTYIESGYLPFYREGLAVYRGKLQEIVRMAIEMDIAPYEGLNYLTVRNMEKLLHVISESVPFIPNITKLADRLGTSRNSILKMLDLMERAEILVLLRRETKGVSYLQKPEKIYLNNPNINYALVDAPNMGNLRETFFVNQLQVRHEATYPRYGDFMIDEQFVFEIGGANKGFSQIKGLPNAYVAADDIKYGERNKIPLWLFGFLY